MVNFIKNIAFVLVVVLLTRVYATAQTSTSVLSSGTWYKIPVTETGIYKLDYDYLNELGLDVDNLNPKKLAIYGNVNNGALPQANDVARPDDLQEHAIYVSGESDNRLNSTDYLLFYGKSSDHLSFDTETNEFTFERNVYSDTAYYFLNVGESNGERIETVTWPSGTNPSSTYKWLETHELEENTIISSGRHWFGERFTTSNRNHQVQFSSRGLINDTDVNIFVGVLSRSTGISSFDLAIDGNNLGTIDMESISSGTYVTQADVKEDTFQINSSNLSSGDSFEIDFQFNEASVKDGYIDYVHVQMEKRLNLNYGPLIWFKESDKENFRVSNLNESTMLWNITDPYQIQNVSFNTTGTTFSFESPGTASQFVAFNDGQELVPYMPNRVANQNLHGLPAADGIIITHVDFLSAARRLADFRTAHDGMLVEVVTVDQIYNEFSSGTQDVSAIRDFIRFQYDKYDQLRYVLMFGDCSFDYKDRSILSTNYVPIYESRNSLHRLWSYSSDDYFGFMEDEEGEWVENQAGDHTLEIGIGRIPIQSLEDGEAVVNKIIRYQTNRLGYGQWRNNITFVADDGDNNIHQQDADKMSTYVDTTRHEFNIRKVFLDAYEQDQNKSPKASQAMLDAITQGNLIVNFTGHGNEGQLTHESIFNEFMISELDNNILMPLFVTATCQFGNYDYPNRVSGGEQIVLLPYGGAIALITATRPVFSNTNYKLNEAFYFSAMQKEDGQFKRLGDIIRETKNNSLVGAGNRNYALLGDPMMRISFPEQEVVLTAIDGKSIDELDTLKAFGTYRVSGEVRSGGTLDPDFDGVVSMTVFDKPAKFQTLGDESVKEIYDQRSVRLFQGQATISSGQFEIDFVVPKNINYSFGEGKINFYALNNTSTVDAHGDFSEVIVGGSNPILSTDITPPEIQIFLNDSTFESGQAVAPSSILLVRLKDESGINISNAGFGNDLMLFLNDEEPIALNDYYSASLDTYQEGWVSYPLDNLSPGRYIAEVVASDIFNNETSQTIEFIVTETNTIKLSNVISYPNPILPHTDQTTISFTHDKLGDDLFAFLTITNMQGREIFTETYRFDNVSENTLEIPWNLIESGVGRVRKGIYIYRLKVQSRVDESSGEVYRRIVILN